MKSLEDSLKVALADLDPKKQKNETPEARDRTEKMVRALVEQHDLTYHEIRKRIEQGETVRDMWDAVRGVK